MYFNVQIQCLRRLGLTFILAGLGAPAMAESANCSASQPCIVDVMVAYTERAAAWSQREQGVSCSALTAEAQDAIYSRVQLQLPEANEAQKLVHPCRAQPEHFASIPSGMPQLIAIAMAELNDIYANSQLPVRFRLVAEHQLMNADGSAYVEGSWLEPDNEGYRESRHPDDLARLLSDNLPIVGELVKARNRERTPFAFQQMAAIKAQAQADLVVMLVAENYGGANVMGIAASVGAKKAENAVAVLQVQGAITPGFAFAHEVSHLLGAGHYEFKSALDLGAVKLLSLDAIHSDGLEYARSAMSPDQRFATLMGGTGDPQSYAIIPLLSNNRLQVVFDGDKQNPATLGSMDNSGKPLRDNASAVLQGAPRIAELNASVAPLNGMRPNAIAVDFGYEQFNNHNYQSVFEPSSTYGYWNNLVQHRKGAKIGGKGRPLLTQNGSQSAIEIKVSSSFSGKNVPPWIVRAFSDFAYDNLPAAAVSDGFYALSNWNDGELTIENLDPKQLYSFEFFGAGPSLAKHRVTEFRIKGALDSSEAHTFSTQLTTEPNILRETTINGVRPRADGRLVITVSGATNWIWHTANLNAMRFWPEEN